MTANAPETACRFFNSCRHYGLPVNAGAFTSGQPTFPYIKAFQVSLFLSANPETVGQTIDAGLPGGLVLPGAPSEEDGEDSTLRIAFDFDGVLASDESEICFQRRGLKAFEQHESERATIPHAPGPLRKLFERLSHFQRLDYRERGRTNPHFKPAIRISIVTSRGAASEERLITTLKSFGMSAAELFFMDGLDKKNVLEVIRPHIFFDDQIRHLEKTQQSIPSVLVPFGIHNKNK